MKKLITLFTVLLLAACSSSGVMQLSANTYMISRTSGAGAFASKGSIQAKVMKEANAFAAKKGKVAVARTMEWDRPSQGFPTFTYQFILVNPEDPRAKDAILEPTPNTVIEDRR